MKSHVLQIQRWLLPIAAVMLGSGCILEMAAGLTPTPQVIVIAGEGGNEPLDSGLPSPTPESVFSLTPTGTLTAATTPVTLTAGQDLSCVTGPDWILYDWVARVLEGETVTLLAKSDPAWPDYYFARRSSGEECWIFGNSSTISGDASGLPVREAPPLPTISYAVENQTALNVASIFVRGKDETAWGANRLGGALLPKATFTLSLTAGFYDVQIVDFMGGILYEKHDTAIGAEQSSRLTVLDNSIRFYFHNIYPNPICQIAFKPNGGTFTDYPIPDDGVISADETVWMTLLAGKYDINISGCGGSFSAGIGNFYIGPAMEGFPS
jgi:hypothetical protein